LQISLENNIFENARNLKVQEALNLLQSVHGYASPETIELLDRIIGGNIHEVPVENVLPTLKAFMGSEHTRPKIIQLLIKKLKDNVDELTLRELCDISLLMREFGSSQEGMYELIEPYILSKVNSLTEDDIMLTIRGFYNPELSKRFKILDILESIVINQADKMDKDNLSDLLQFYTSYRMGSRIVIETLKARVEGNAP
jgi:hypothetical protein